LETAFFISSGGYDSDYEVCLTGLFDLAVPSDTFWTFCAYFLMSLLFAKIGTLSDFTSSLAFSFRGELFTIAIGCF